MAGTWLLGPGGRTDAAPPLAVLVAVDDGDVDVEASLAELARLADTDGVAVADTVVQRREHPDPATYVGSGTVRTLQEVLERTGASLVVCDDELSPAQVRTLEERTGARVVDRTALILDVFAEHARSSEGRTQVELAQIAYQLPRLRGRGAQMSRIGGGRVAGGAGIGVRGPGEMRLESERRRLRRRAGELRRRTRDIAARRERTRTRRQRDRVPSVAITGYTNAGKSALLNRLTAAEVEVRDELFATLDPTVRRLVVDGSAFTVTDTVGFVRNLPHQLVDAFRSTLEEVVGADLVVHVVDASAPDAMAQVTTVRGVLHEIGASHLPEVLVLNKVDVAPAEWVDALRRAYPGAPAVSALTGEGVPELRHLLARRVRELSAAHGHPAGSEDQQDEERQDVVVDLREGSARGAEGVTR
ncbi:GTPase HflX [Kineococcus indalonis]|uniref:GTPase HflX n=1 Tax=Kineococcus indalonis TaxID=2696566 RepID=UPI0014129BC9|nr:GTPase HflX [Kineococcus indalonis]NAZ88325.1 GTPase HflX [Kineococcus indalonis]